MTALLRGQAVHEVTLRITTAADSIPSEWDWVTLLDLGGDEAVEVTDWKVVPFVDEPWPVGTGTKAPGQPMTITETLALFGETPCECEACLAGEREVVQEHGLHQLALITTWAPAVLDSLGLPRCSTVEDGLCQTCGLEAYDPDCGCVCECHHTCE